MTDDRLQDLLDDAKRGWRVPPEPPVDAMWLRVEADAFVPHWREGRRGWRSRPSWFVFAGGLAAALVLGVGLGRLAHPRTVAGDVRQLPAVRTVADAAPDGLNGAYQQTTTEFLGRTAVLLTSLSDHSDPRREARVRAQAGELLVTTRLLLDSPAASDRQMHELLDDLELVLVQVARLRESRSHEDLQLITDALEERDVVPRIHTVVAQLASGAD